MDFPGTHRNQVYIIYTPWVFTMYHIRRQTRSYKRKFACRKCHASFADGVTRKYHINRLGRHEEPHRQLKYLWWGKRERPHLGKSMSPFFSLSLSRACKPSFSSRCKATFEIVMKDVALSALLHVCLYTDYCKNRKRTIWKYFSLSMSDIERICLSLLYTYMYCKPVRGIFDFVTAIFIKKQNIQNTSTLLLYLINSSKIDWQRIYLSLIPAVFDFFDDRPRRWGGWRWLELPWHKTTMRDSTVWEAV